MLVLARRIGEAISIGKSIKVTVLKSKGNRVNLGIDAPDDVAIRRTELKPHVGDRDSEVSGSADPRDAIHPHDKILVVDDSRVERVLAGSLLASQLDCEIVFAEDGRDALEKMREMKPDLVVTDLVMPEMDGLQLVREGRLEFPQIPMILMTAHGNESLAVVAMNAGAASYVPKAKRAECLVETAQRVLARKRANENREKLTRCLGKIDAAFYLENDPATIPPLVDYVQQMVGGLELSDETERIRAGVALEEALVNAMCHGNLELTPEELDRARGLGASGVRNLIEQRRHQSPYCDRKVVLEVHVTNDSARFVIRDAGKGFDRMKTCRVSQKDCFQNGAARGVTLMNLLMDDVAYNDEGNEVTLIKVATT